MRLHRRLGQECLGQTINRRSRPPEWQIRWPADWEIANGAVAGPADTASNHWFFRIEGQCDKQKTLAVCAS